jgi:hypothetical protein
VPARRREAERSGRLAQAHRDRGRRRGGRAAALSLIDLLPEFPPVIGSLDDVVVVALALRHAARRVPHQVLLEAWPGDPRLLERLLGTPAPVTHPAEPEVPRDAPGTP